MARVLKAFFRVKNLRNGFWKGSIPLNLKLTKLTWFELSFSGFRGFRAGANGRV